MVEANAGLLAPPQMSWEFVGVQQQTICVAANAEVIL